MSVSPEALKSDHRTVVVSPHSNSNAIGSPSGSDDVTLKKMISYAPTNGPVTVGMDGARLAGLQLEPRSNPATIKRPILIADTIDTRTEMSNQRAEAAKMSRSFLKWGACLCSFQMRLAPREFDYSSVSPKLPGVKCEDVLLLAGRGSALQRCVRVGKR